MDIIHGPVDRIDDPNEVGGRSAVLLADDRIAEPFTDAPRINASTA
jgi:hypothetical protein